jgi:hypothetical protein
LAARVSGATGRLRQAIAEVIESSIEIVASDPPAEPQEHTKALLDLCMSHSESGATLKAVLRRHLHGKLSEDKIPFYTKARNPNKKKFAQFLAKRLLPTRIIIFARNRWLTTLAPLRTLALLDTVHNLLRRSVPLWVEKLKKGGHASLKVKKKPKARAPRVEGLDVMVSSESETEADAVGRQAAKAKGRSKKKKTGGNASSKAQPDKEIDWAVINEQHRGDSLHFAAGHPGPKLIIGCICLEPCVSLMRSLETTGARSWDIEQSAHHIDKLGMATRIAGSQAGALTSKFFDELVHIMASEASFAALDETHYTISNASLAFSMLSAAICGGTEKFHFRHSGFPFTLWSLFGKDAEAAARWILSVRSCLLDPFSKAFLKRFRGELLGDLSLSILHAIAVALRLDIMRLECRNASLRRAVKKSVQTWSRTAEGTHVYEVVLHFTRETVSVQV